MEDEVGVICVKCASKGHIFLLQRLRDEAQPVTQRFRLCDFVTAQIPLEIYSQFLQELRTRKQAFEKEFRCEGATINEIIRARREFLEERNSEEFLKFLKGRAILMIEQYFGSQSVELLRDQIVAESIYLPRPVQSEGGEYTSHLFLVRLEDAAFDQAARLFGKAIEPVLVNSAALDDVILWDHVLEGDIDGPANAISMSHAERVVLRRVSEFIDQHFGVAAA